MLARSGAGAMLCYAMLCYAARTFCTWERPDGDIGIAGRVWGDFVALRYDDDMGRETWE